MFRVSKGRQLGFGEVMWIGLPGWSQWLHEKRKAELGGIAWWYLPSVCRTMGSLLGT